MKSALLCRASVQMRSAPVAVTLLHNETDTSNKKLPPPTHLQLYTHNRLRPSCTADHSALSCLHDILELEESIVRRLRIIWVHRRVQVVRHGRVSDDLRHGIVNVHDLARRHRRNRLAEPCVDGPM